VAGIYWVLQQVSGAGGATVADALRRALGVTSAGVAAPHHELSDTASSAAAEGSAAAATVIASARAPAPATAPRAGSAHTSPTSKAAGHGTASHRTRSVVAARTIPLVHWPILRPLPASTVLQNDYQVFETWNNCGPASLSMALSYFGIQESQAVLGQDLRPYQNAYGNNDDKDVTMDEMATEARKFGLLAYHRPDGNIQLLKRFLASGLPVIAETVLTKDDDIGHYRVVKGYDDSTGTITQDDSMQGHNVQFSYADFDYMWKKYNYEYLVLVPKDKQLLAEEILGKDLNDRTAWRETVKMDQAMLARNPSDIDSRFNLSVALYYVGDYRGSVTQFEQVQYQLPARTLWYQIEPIEAYYALGEYQRVFSLTDTILNNGNRAFSQLYILRGKIDLKQGNVQAARAEFENAVLYNKNLKAAQDALRSIS
jgi:tetratricopeptide (TPR) repeat protein